MLYNPQDVEKEILMLWKKRKIFDKLRKNNMKGKAWSFIDGPITANNPMGVHHAWGRTYKDLFQRFKAMQGFDQRFQNGFDCQGLWVEVEVEKDIGMNTKKEIEAFGLDKFSEACKKRVAKYSKIQTEQSILLGQWMDWKNSYYTLTDKNIEHIWHFLKKCHENKWLFEGTRVLPWCLRCGTSLSQHEMTDTYKEVTHKGVFVLFPIIGKKNEYLLVWTTTAWTLAANVAVAVHPNVKYVKVRQGDKHYYLSKTALPILDGKYEVEQELIGADIIGVTYRGPFDELSAQNGIVHRVVEWDLVGEEEGTGLVHIAPGCGVEDNELGKAERLDEIAPLDEEGKYIEGFGFLTGKSVNEVNDLIFNSLKSKGMLYKVEDYSHRYPTCWRCKEELVFRMENAWFISSDEIRPRMKKANKDVKWVPSFGQKRMDDWLNNMGDWNISRKRYWGLPLPFYKCKNNHLTVIGSKKELNEKAIDKNEVNNLKELHRPWIDKIKIKCPECGDAADRIPDVGDCWLDAGIVPFSTLNYMTDKKHWKKWFPANLVLEMMEQIRLWFYSMLFMSVTLEDRAPYKSVMVYEKVTDEKGVPMHKSLGNAIWFDDAIKKMGADVMRWIYLSHSPTRNLPFGYTRAREVQRDIDIIFNLNNYVKMYCELNGFKKTRPNRLDKASTWLLSRTETVKQEITDHIENLNPNLAIDALKEFILNDFSRWYVHIVRDKLKRGYMGKDKQGILYAMYYSMLEAVKLLAPMLPFVAEKMYQDFFKKYEKNESIHLFRWPAVDKKAIDLKLEKNMETARLIFEAATAKRQEAGAKLRWPLAGLTVTGDTNTMVAAKSMKDILAQTINVKDVKTKRGRKLSIRLGKVLKDEALLRELIRKTQSLRKLASLLVHDQIKLRLETDGKTEQLLKRLEKDLLKGTGAKSVEFGTVKKSQGDIAFEGKAIKIGFRKA